MVICRGFLWRERGRSGYGGQGVVSAFCTNEDGCPVCDRCSVGVAWSPCIGDVHILLETRVCFSSI